MLVLDFVKSSIPLDKSCHEDQEKYRNPHPNPTVHEKGVNFYREA